ncbi:plasmid mobilization protein [Clostridium estertheticum]|uniref:plasmid mobilization protein n=1 Tax=Clostridium estertheticum TaxID=238834 RepID=UPI001C0B431B|nr:hypothetical protein [Clostridium estertheticum]MBU3173363.1 hypothetical protein [Clostridium estertheticum]
MKEKKSTKGENVRGKSAQCKLSENEYKEFKEKATALGLAVSSYLRVICLKSEICIDLKPLQNVDKSVTGKEVKGLKTIDQYKSLEKKANSLGLSIYVSLKPLEADDGVIREVTAQCRLSEDEYNELELKAKALGLDVTRYLRVVCLRAEIYVALKPLQQSEIL